MLAVKCYLGQLFFYLYEGEVKRFFIYQWFSKLVKIQKKIFGYILVSVQLFLFFQDLLLCLQVDKYVEQLQDVILDFIYIVIYIYNVIILVFLDYYNYYYVEEKVFQVKKKFVYEK